MDIPPPDIRPKKTEEGFGPFFAIIIIVGIIALGGIYFLITGEMERRANPPGSEGQASL